MLSFLSLWRREWQTISVFLPREPHKQYEISYTWAHTSLIWICDFGLENEIFQNLLYRSSRQDRKYHVIVFFQLPYYKEHPDNESVHVRLIRKTALRQRSPDLWGGLDKPPTFSLPGEGTGLPRIQTHDTHPRSSLHTRRPEWAV